jgi:hypothetical protein
MPKPLAGHHWSIAQSGRKWLSTNLIISLSSSEDGWNMCG